VTALPGAASLASVSEGDARAFERVAMAPVRLRGRHAVISIGLCES
jgi:hypothetical protein